MVSNTFPSSTLFHFPIMLLLSDGKIHTRKELVAFEIKKLSISAEDQVLQSSTGDGKKGMNKVASWTAFAITDLRMAGYIIHEGDGYILTESGKHFFELHKNGFEAKELRVSPSYRKYKNIKDNPKLKDETKKDEVSPSKEPTKSSEDGVVYILTNPAFKTFYIKIGYTTSIEDRLKELYNTSVPLPFKVYALLKTSKYKLAEKMIHSAFKASRIGDDREFFMLKPEEALDQMKVVAEALEADVTQYDEKGNIKKIFNYSK